jgi:cyclohexanecarboxylate-CoA ligase
MPLRGCGDVVLLETWDPERALDLVDRYGVTFTMGATPFLNDLLDAAHRRGGARFPEMFVCAGAPIPPSLIERAVHDHDARVVSGWGMSEYPIGTSTAVTDGPALASTCDGRPAGRAEIVVVDSSGAPVGIGDEGDLLIRGPGLFEGYYKRPDLNEASLTDDGFLKTGDRARLLDSRGHIRISGRTKDIIIRGGENIPVVEIENLLLTHPAVKEVALVPVPDPRLGETACACVVLHTGAEPVDVASIADFLGGHGVAKQFYPESVQLMFELPRTPSGKIQKFALRDLVLDDGES